MTWMTKDLTLKLLEIAISGLVETYDTIKGDQPGTPAPQQTSAPAEPQAEPQTAAEPASTPPVEDNTPEPTPTMPDIQTALRTIAQKEGVDWIQNELFAGLHIDNITKLPEKHIPLAWELMTTHLTEIEAEQ